MFKIGLLGGIASGKSAVARLLASHGAVVLEADAYAQLALDHPEVVRSLVDRWGPSVVDANGRVARREVAQRVFGPGQGREEDRKFLEGLIHPRVRRALLDEVSRAAASGVGVVVLDIPLLIEAGWRQDCDLLLFVDAPEEDRRARAAARGWDAQELANRERAQLPIPKKRGCADAVVANDGDLDRLAENVASVWQRHVAPRLGPSLGGG